MILISNSKAFVQSTSLPESFEIETLFMLDLGCGVQVSSGFVNPLLVQKLNEKSPSPEVACTVLTDILS